MVDQIKSIQSLLNFSHRSFKEVPKNLFNKFLIFWDFPGGAVVKNPPTNAEDTGLSPGPGRSHMPESN